MQTIKITITSERPTNLVITERKPGSKESIRKAALSALDELFNPIFKDVAEAREGKTYAIKRKRS